MHRVIAGTEFTKRFTRVGILTAALCFAASSCNENTDLTKDSLSCPTTLSGTPWVPNVVASDGTPSGSAQHNSSNEIYRDYYISNSGNLTGLTESYAGANKVVTISQIDMATDLLEKGSLSIVAEPVGVSSSFKNSGGYVWPVLISLSDGVNEYVNVNGCSAGFFTSCSGGSCSFRSGCGPTSPTAYLGNTDRQRRDQWSQFQNILTTNEYSQNQFPTCNWSASGSYDCAFNSNFFVAHPSTPAVKNRLRVGTYTAKYVMLTNSLDALNSSYSGSVRLTVVRKKGVNAATNNAAQAMDLNVVLVGTKNIEDSRTLKGKQNLDALFQHVYNQYYVQNKASVGIRLGTVNVYEWDCQRGGDTYANVPDINALFADGSTMMPLSTEGKAMNIFITSTIQSDQSFLGMAGAIGGPVVNGTSGSGLVFASFDQLASFNPICFPGSPCTIDKQESSFMDMGSTISHEMGHYLGLNHPNERDGTDEDWLSDTPTCHKTQSTNYGGVITQFSCASETNNPFPASGKTCKQLCPGYNGVTNFCPSVPECQFNHVMWWTGKYFADDGSGQGDGNIFSTMSGTIMNYSPYVR